MIFKIWRLKCTIKPKKAIWPLAIWQNWCFGWSYHSKMEKYTISLSQFLRYVMWPLGKTLSNFFIPPLKTWQPLLPLSTYCPKPICCATVTYGDSQWSLWWLFGHFYKTNDYQHTLNQRWAKNWKSQAKPTKIFANI